jgi:hypothetical protein
MGIATSSGVIFEISIVLKLEIESALEYVVGTMSCYVTNLFFQVNEQLCCSDVVFLDYFGFDKREAGIGKG